MDFDWLIGWFIDWLIDWNFYFYLAKFSAYISLIFDEGKGEISDKPDVVLKWLQRKLS